MTQNNGWNGIHVNLTHLFVLCHLQRGHASTIRRHLWAWVCWCLQLRVWFGRCVKVSILFYFFWRGCFARWRVFKEEGVRTQEGRISCCAAVKCMHLLTRNFMLLNWDHSRGSVTRWTCIVHLSAIKGIRTWKRVNLAVVLAGCMCANTFLCVWDNNYIREMIMINQ